MPDRDVLYGSGGRVATVKPPCPGEASMHRFPSGHRLTTSAAGGSLGYSCIVDVAAGVREYEQSIAPRQRMLMSTIKMHCPLS